MSDGGAYRTTISPFPVWTEVMVGGAGGAVARLVAALLAVPAPRRFTARMATSYSVPTVTLLISMGETVDTASAQLSPPSSEYW